MKYIHSIHFKTNIFAFFFFIFFLLSIYLLFSFLNKDELEKDAYNKSVITAQKINAQLKEQLARMQTLATLLANSASLMDFNHKKNKIILATLLNLPGYEDFIAGGGIWPEPYIFDKNKKRSSYFLARNKEKSLKFIDDYNNVEGSGYHDKEWYTPVKKLQKGQAYWSQSYIDPHSFEPMVTVSVPIYKKNTFIGVATVDIMLNGLQDFLKENMKNLHGYAFILDRKQKFLSFPPYKNMKVNNDYIHFDVFTKTNPAYQQLNLKPNDNTTHLFTLPKDPLLQEESSAISILQADTQWNIVIVVPNSIILSQSNKMFNHLIITVFLLGIFSTLLLFYLINKGIVTPLLSMKKQLTSNSTINLIEANRNDEIGILAKEFNKKIHTIEEKIKENTAMHNQVLLQSRLAQMGELISMIAHQWKQPLNAISLTASSMHLKLEMNSFDLTTPEGQKLFTTYYSEKLDDITIYTNHLANIIDDFRSFYKKDKNYSQHTLEGILKKALHIADILFKKDSIKVIVNYKDTNTLLMLENEMVQVISNILKNAHDNFLSKLTKNPVIHITIENNILSISDNGGGIEEAFINKIFEPYFSTKDIKNGTGLGLHMAYVIVTEHHKGTIDVTNTHDGVCFKIDLNMCATSS